MSAAPRRPAALVTGAAGGVGGATAERLLAEGARVTLVCRDPAGVAELAARFPDSTQVHVADLGRLAACEDAVAATIDRWGRIDVLVNCAATLARRPLEEVTEESLREVFAVNFAAVLWLCRAAMADMRPRGWGRIVNVTSVGVHTGGYSATSAVYEASKAAVGSLTKTLSRDGAKDGILVNTVAPGATRTPMMLDQTSPQLLAEVAADIPLGRLAEPAEIAALIAFLCGAANTYATGACFDVNGGLAMP